jgi:hypothetical protein
MTIGIYRLRFNTLEDWPYIGQSSNIEQRYVCHKSELKHGKSNYMLLEAYNITNSYPLLDIIEICTVSELTEKEIFYIKKYNSYKNGLNITDKVVNNGRGQDHFRSLVSNEDIIKLLHYLVNNPNKLLTDISKELNIPIAIIKSFNKGRNHTWIGEIYPEEYDKMINISRLGLWDAKRQGIKYPRVISPQGEVYTIENLQKFCRDHNVNNSSLHQLLTGKRKSANKWKLA